MKLANLKIGKRLALGFGIVCAMLVLMVALSNAMLARVNAGTDEIVNGRMPKIEMTGQMQADINDIAIAIRNMMLTDDPADRQKLAEEVIEHRRSMNAILAELDKSLVSARGKELLAQMKQETAGYVSGQDKLIRLINLDELDAARSLLKSELRPLLVRLKKATAEQSALQKQIAMDAAAEAARTYRSTSILMWGLGFGALALAAAVAWSITRSITRPVAKALEVANTVAAGDLTSRIQVDTRDEMGQLLQALKAMNENLARTVGVVRTGTDTIAVAAAQVAAGSQDLSSRTEQQAGALEETASSMEELTSTVRQNADNARQANVLAEAAANVAARGGQVIGQVVGTMGEINDSANKINDIIGVIDGIAFQTNILALNAAVEAARAGEQGRGFAVVAGEVRNLAQRSANAAKEIKALIGASTDKVASGSKLVAEAGATMQEIVDSVRRVTDIMAEISSASMEQTSGIEQINQAVVQMDETTQQNAALVEEAAAASSQMQEQAAMLAKAVAVFQIGAAQAAPVAAQVKTPALPKPAAAPVPARAPAKAKASATAGDWEEF
ncbi:methyl-accepting chemotaxis protein [Massilia sp. ZL223]|uniref:methyl-accepting chemotaxis protein n=1 Tax=Massilia sp. ZL223 TaxID=2824904 RepID=UPI001B831068|nr:methyl-accepting chemotaxis protein [Massilia sp. ZL223]MBQ5963953.1 MCP four helix bundle domain-containing protein [Massilia sp. ZL223]